MLPASAGMILPTALFIKVNHGAPRIRGDDPIKKGNMMKNTQCSPHPRG